MENSLYDLCQVVKDKSTVTTSMVVDRNEKVKKVYHQVGILYKDEDDLNERLAHLLLTGEAIDYKPKDAISVDSPKEDSNNTIESLQNVIGDHGGSIINFPSENTYSFKEFKLSGNTHNIELHEFLKVPFESLNKLKELKLDKLLGIKEDSNKGIWMGHFEINPRNVFCSIK